MVLLFLVLWRRRSFHRVFCNDLANLHSNQQHARAPLFLSLLALSIIHLFYYEQVCVRSSLWLLIKHLSDYYWCHTFLHASDCLSWLLFGNIPSEPMSFFNCQLFSSSCWVSSFCGAQSSAAPSNHVCLVFFLLPCGWGGYLQKEGVHHPNHYQEDFFHICVLLTLHFPSCV